MLFVRNAAQLMAIFCLFLGSSACFKTPPMPTPLITVGDAHSCAYDTLNGLRCWGDNSNGQVQPPAGLSGLTSLAAGHQFTCAGKSSGVSCWGLNDQQQLNAPALTGVLKVTAGYDHACAIHSGGVSCWGSNANGQLNGQPIFNNPLGIAAGGFHTCVLDNDGVKCWGQNDAGQTDVPPLINPSKLAAGGKHNCVLDTGSLLCWGDNSLGQLDNIPTLSNLKSLSAGAAHSCVVDDSGVRCWGGNSSLNNSSLNILNVRELTWPEQVVVGGEDGGEVHACAYHLQGIACWGDNSKGQAHYPGAIYGKVYRAEIEIDVAPAGVWAVLTDLNSYPLWNPFTIQMRSTLQVGEPIIMRVKMAPNFAVIQTMYVMLIEPNHKACWGTQNNFPQLQSAARCQWLEPLDGGTRTRYVTEDYIQGKTVPIVKQLFENNLLVNFANLAAALKARAEALY